MTARRAEPSLVRLLFIAPFRSAVKETLADLACLPGGCYIWIMAKVPITRDGYERLYWQLQYLLKESRPEVGRALAAARESGLTSRNLEWRTAREKQHLVETRIQQLTDMMDQCEVFLVPAGSFGRVQFGLFVEVVEGFTGRGRVFQMVGPFESDVESGRLSVHSPVGRKLLGRRVGERVWVKCPGGLSLYQVTRIFGPGCCEPRPVQDDSLQYAEAVL